jgi:putative transposase
MPRDVSSCPPGFTRFFTLRAARHGSDLFVRNIEPLRHAMRLTRAAHPFVIDEIVVLPDVIHMLWALPEGDGRVSLRMRMLKSLFSRQVTAPQHVEPQRLRPGEKGVWQRRFCEHAISDDDDLAAHRHMILMAPVQAGLVDGPAQWPHSSIHRAIRRGSYLPDRPCGAVGSTGLVGRSPRPLAIAAQS